MSTPLRDEEHGHPIARPQATPEPEGAGEPQLKPCPFCGGKGAHDGNTLGYWILCLNMDCSGETPYYGSPAEAAAVWNRRPVEDHQAAELAALRERLAKVERERDAAITVAIDHETRPRDTYRMRIENVGDLMAWHLSEPHRLIRSEATVAAVLVRAAAGLAGEGEEGRTP